MNQECLRLTAMPMALLERVLNLARIINLVYYKDEDGYTHAKSWVKKFVAALLIESLESSKEVENISSSQEGIPLLKTMTRHKVSGFGSITNKFE
ncbi:hypothetical protein LguiB_028260 [Lonicera macranthoides]